MESTLEIHKYLDNFRAYINSFDKWKASTGEILTLQELIVTKNTFPFLRGIPISEIEKYRDLSRARWNVTTSRTKDASTTIDAYGVDVNKTKVKFIDGYISYEIPHEREEIGQAFSELIRMLVNETSDDPGDQRKSDTYVDSRRLIQLKSTESSGYDLRKLIQLCEELNKAHQNNCYMSITMILRAIIDHIPPIFKANTFPEIANNYKGTKSFKKAMEHLDNSLRNIADSHLHIQIRKKEDLPTFNQVNFIADLDLLLSEIVRIIG
jgi:hypothetical protein